MLALKVLLLLMMRLLTLLKLLAFRFDLAALKLSHRHLLLNFLNLLCLGVELTLSLLDLIT